MKGSRTRFATLTPFFYVRLSLVAHFVPFGFGFTFCTALGPIATLRNYGPYISLLVAQKTFQFLTPAAALGGPPEVLLLLLARKWSRSRSRSKSPGNYLVAKFLGTTRRLLFGLFVVMNG